MTFRAQNRWQAFGLHLVVSFLLFLMLAAIIYFLWYPGFLFRYDGGLEGIKLIAGVDFIIGPILTLLVYKLGKASLRFQSGYLVVDIRNGEAQGFLPTGAASQNRWQDMLPPVWAGLIDGSGWAFARSYVCKLPLASCV